MIVLFLQETLCMPTRGSWTSTCPSLCIIFTIELLMSAPLRNFAGQYLCDSFIKLHEDLYIYHISSHWSLVISLYPHKLSFINQFPSQRPSFIIAVSRWVCNLRIYFDDNMALFNLCLFFKCYQAVVSRGIQNGASQESSPQVKNKNLNWFCLCCCQVWYFVLPYFVLPK